MTDPLDRSPASSPDPQDGDGVAVLEQGLWRQLSAAGSVTEAAPAWAPLMAAMLDGAEAVTVFTPDPDTGQLRSSATWPDRRLPGGRLLAAAEEALKSGRNIVQGDMGAGTGPVAAAVPIRIEGMTAAVAGVELRAAARADLHLAMRRLQWGVAWLRDLARGQNAALEGQRYTRAVHALNLVVGVAEQKDFATAVRSAATSLAARFDCDRVSIGFRRFGRTKLTAISHSAQFGKEMNLARLLSAAMDEAIDQRGVLQYPEPSDGGAATHRHAKLAQAHGIGHVLSVPIYAFDRFIGAIVFERPADRPFTQDEAEILEAVVTVIAPVLEERRRNDRWLIVKAGEAVGTQITRLIGPGYLARKTVVAAILGLCAFFWFAMGVDRVASNAVVEGAIQRTLSAPYDGFIADAPARAGDEVAEGDLIVQFDDRDLALERLRLVTELDRLRIEFSRALAERNRTETSIRRSQIDQSEARIALIDKQIERAAVRAPFDGLVTSGDLSQSIGAAVTRGEPLLTIAPLAEFRIVLQVDERRIAHIAPGQVGQLLVTAYPSRPFPIEVTTITPVAEYAGGQTTFRVEATVTGPRGPLQPGMEGVAKVDLGEARLIAIWTAPFREWLHLTAWRWLGVDLGSVADGG